MYLKKTKYFLILLLIFVSKAHSQEEESYGFDKGDFFISGGVNYQGPSDKTLFIEPNAGYFLTENIAIGIESGFAVGKTLNLTSYDSYEAGIFGQYYFRPKKRFNLFAEISAGYVKTKTELRSINVDFDTFHTTLSFGANFFLTKKLSLFTKIDVLEYSNTSIKSNGIIGPTEPNNIRVLPLNTGVHLGLRFKF